MKDHLIFIGICVAIAIIVLSLWCYSQDRRIDDLEGDMYEIQQMIGIEP